MNRFYNISPATKLEIFNEIAINQGIPNYAVEKDWWVVQTLSLLFETEIGPHLVFKGGTSLSKAWNIIERFSEDIDLAVDRKFLGFKGVLSRTQIKNLRKKTNKYITVNLLNDLNQRFKAKGITNVNLELSEIHSKDQDPVIINVNYPSVTETPGYINHRVQIEIGCRSLIEPNEAKEIISLVDYTYSHLPFTTDSICIPTVLPDRTFLEKIFLLHEEFQRPADKIRVDRLSRHLYDIYQLSKTMFAERALNNRELYETIVNHRYKYTSVAGIDYSLHQPQTINPIPTDTIISKWETDYKTMQEQMIHGESPSFSDLITAVTHIKTRINSINWTINLTL